MINPFAVHLLLICRRRADSQTTNSPGSETHTAKQLSKHKFRFWCSCPHGRLVERKKRCLILQSLAWSWLSIFGCPFLSLVWARASLFLDYLIRVGFSFDWFELELELKLDSFTGWSGKHKLNWPRFSLGLLGQFIQGQFEVVILVKKTKHKIWYDDNAKMWAVHILTTTLPKFYDILASWP